MDDARVLKRLYSYMAREKIRFEGILPTEYRTLKELLDEDKPSVKLNDGTRHFFDRDELVNLSRRLPWYIHRLVRLPWVLTYRREYWGGRFYLRNPDPWAARAISYLLTGNLAGEKRVLTVDEAVRLLRSFKTLIIVSIEVQIEWR